MCRFVLALMVLTAAVSQAAEYPTAVLKNDSIKITVRMPDAEKGFYRGTRFDWSGVIGPVEVLGKTVFVPWKNTHNPANNDDITGPCDEFSNTVPLNFKEAKEGERFLKIGVGELVKGKDNEYAFHKKYAIAKAGTWDVPVSETVIAFRQTFTTDFGYAYKYSKQIKLADDGKRGFRITYRLVNTGTKRIDTDVYNHNFFNVKGASTGKGFSVTFPFEPKLIQPRERFNELVKRNDKELSFQSELDNGSIYTLLEGFGESAKDTQFVLQGGGVMMTVTGDKPLSKVALWGMKTTLCPEPYIAIRLAPGEEMNWSWSYDFTKIE
jgi:hypothetical protein